jgi:kynurenine formamidase
MTSLPIVGRRDVTDEAGAPGDVTPAQSLAALANARTGQVVSLAEVLGPNTAAPPHRARPARFMSRDAGDYALGARTPGGLKFAEDVVQFPTHSGTHVDALAHTWTGNTLYNGHPESSTRTTRGAARCGADKLPPVLTRGVLIDLVSSMGTALAPSQAVEVDDLRRGVLESGVKIATGDTVLIRTGWNETVVPGRDRFALEPGITADSATWLAERGVVLIGADNYAVEQQTDEVGFPAHLILMQQHGIPLIENVVLAPLAAELARADRSTFLFVFAPIPLEGSTASPVNPLAVL